MPENSYLKLLIQERLGADVQSWIFNRSKQGLSVRKIAEELSEETGIKVSKSTVNLWMQ